jgi:hypothetical protein
MAYTNRPGTDRQGTRKKFPAATGRRAAGTAGDQAGERTVPHAPGPFGFLVVPFDMV